MKAIIVPTDFSEYSTNAVLTAAQIAEKTGGKIFLLHNVQTFTQWDGLSETERNNHPETLKKTADAEAKLDTLMHSGYLKNLNVQKLVTHGVTSDEIVNKARQLHADFIVIGSHGNEKSGRNFIGSNVQKVLRKATCPVLAVKKYQPDQKWNRLLIPVSFDEDISAPLKQLKRLAEQLHATIRLVFINTPLRFKDDETVYAQRNAFQLKYPELKFETAIYFHNELEQGILQYAKESGTDWIAMITHKLQRQPQYLIGVTDTIVFHADLPVVSVHIKSPVARYITGSKTLSEH